MELKIIKLFVFSLLLGIGSIISYVIAIYIIFNIILFFQKNKKQFKFGEYIFKEVQTQKEKELFYQLLSRDYQAFAKKSDIIIKLKENDSLFEDSTKRFIAYFQNKPVGIVKVTVDSKIGLPMETELGGNYDFSLLRKYGKLMEIGRLWIDKSFRLKPDLLKGLIKCAFDEALKQKVVFIIEDAFEHTLPMYEKLGFARFDAPAVFEKLYGLYFYPLYLNLVEKVIKHKKHNSPIKKILNYYAAGVYYIYFIFLNFLKPKSFKIWNIDIKKVKIRKDEN